MGLFLSRLYTAKTQVPFMWNNGAKWRQHESWWQWSKIQNVVCIWLNAARWDSRWRMFSNLKVTTIGDLFSHRKFYLKREQSPGVNIFLGLKACCLFYYYLYVNIEISIYGHINPSIYPYIYLFIYLSIYPGMSWRRSWIWRLRNWRRNWD